jgi:CBS domain containing-hemolysin-like protein
LVELSVAGMLAIGLPILALHLFSIALVKALRSYSRSLLEQRCTQRGHPQRADAVAHLDQRTERSAESLAVVTGLFLAAMLGLWVARASTAHRVELASLLVLAIGLLGYVIAGVFGKVFAEPILDAFWPVTGLIRATALPLTFGLRLVERLVEWLAGRSEGPPRPASVEVEFQIPTEEEVPEDVEPELPESVRELLERAVELTRTDVSEIMTPRPLMVSLPSSVSAETAAATFRQTGLSRVPLFGENHDDIVGILYAKDLFARMTELKDWNSISPRTLVRPVHCIPETKNAFELLEEMRVQRRQIAIVLDEYGGVAGLVTLEDLFEELVGAIDDEHDVPTPEDPVRKLGDSRYEVDATLSMESLNERLRLHLPTNGEFMTVGGLALHSLGRVPQPGDTFRADGIAFEVVDVQGHRIRRLVVDLQGAEPVGTMS